jgi:hypothetical protein
MDHCSAVLHWIGQEYVDWNEFVAQLYSFLAFSLSEHGVLLLRRLV